MCGVSMSSQHLQCSDDLPVLYVTVSVPELTSCLPQDVLVRSRFVCKKLPQGVHLRPRHSKGYPSHINIAKNPNSNQSESLIY